MHFCQYDGVNETLSSPLKEGQHRYRISLASCTLLGTSTRTLKLQGVSILLHFVLCKLPPFSHVAELPKQAQLTELFTGITFGFSVWLHHLLPLPHPSNMISHTFIETKECTLPPYI